jgi:uncharacterized membrane protein HdeD (DUF308 family)
MPQTSNDPVRSSVRAAVRHELAAMQEHWWWFLALGVAWVVLGSVALSSAIFTTKAAVALFGLLMLVAGIAQIVSAFWAGRWSGFLLQLLIGILYAVVGYIVFQHPLESAAALTLLIASFLLVGGIIRIVVALSERMNGWGWVLLNGAVSTLLGVMILHSWPVTGAWVIGLFIGIEMIFNGLYWVMLAFGLKTSPAIDTEV